MNASTHPSPRDNGLKPILEAFIATIITFILLTCVVLQSHSHALGATDLPHLSQVGEMRSAHPGGSLLPIEFLKHNVYSQDWKLHRLIPEMKQNNILNIHAVTNLFNIIYIIKIRHSEHYSGLSHISVFIHNSTELSTNRQQTNSRIENQFQNEIISHIHNRAHNFLARCKVVPFVQARCVLV